MGYFKDLFIAIDQLGNALAGGDPDNTISARVGYFANYDDKTKDIWYWNFFEWIINFTFYPNDGKDHCLQSYYCDPGENYRGEGYRILYVFAAFIIISTCIPISIIMWTCYLFGMRPKPYVSIDNIWDQTITIQREIMGIELEFTDQNDNIIKHKDIANKSIEDLSKALNYTIQKTQAFKQKVDAKRIS